MYKKRVIYRLYIARRILYFVEITTRFCLQERSEA